MEMGKAARVAIGSVGALLACALGAAPAHAGTYRVLFCNTAGGVFDNASWFGPKVAGISTDTVCPTAGTRIGLVVAAGKTARIADGAVAPVTLTAPAGTTLADFHFARTLQLTNTVASGTHGLYVLYKLGGTPFYGAGDYQAATVNRLAPLKSWAASIDSVRVTNTLRSFRALAGYDGKATSITIELGCYSRGTPCSHTGGGRASNILYGSDVVLNDTTKPAVTVEAFGLLAGGVRNGREPIRLSASDNSGINNVQLIDVTGSPPEVVASEDYDAQLTDASTGCSYRLTHPCPNLGAETVTPAGVSAGARKLIVRVTDTGGNVTDRGPFTVNVVPPFDRGPLNGTGATETGRVVATFPHTRRTTRTVRFNRRVTILGRVYNAAGAPVGGAIVHVLRKDERANSRWRTGATIHTRADGRFTYRTRATASRALQLAWPSHVNDPVPAASGHLRLRTAAGATFGVSPRHVVTGQRFRVFGRLRGYGFPRRPGKLLLLQAYERGRWRLAKKVRAHADGRFATRTRFTQPSPSRVVRFRVFVPAGPDFPYAAGVSSARAVRLN
jgi:hypothetical protein